MTKELAPQLRPMSLLSGQILGKELVILGRFEGSIEIGGRLRIGKHGYARAQVRSSRVDVEGEFEGEILTGMLVLGETARAQGLFHLERLSMREGAVLNGAVNPSAAQEGAPDGPKLSSAEETSVHSEIERWEVQGGPSN